MKFLKLSTIFTEFKALLFFILSDITDSKVKLISSVSILLLKFLIVFLVCWQTFNNFPKFLGIISANNFLGIDNTVSNTFKITFADFKVIFFTSFIRSTFFWEITLLIFSPVSSRTSVILSNETINIFPIIFSFNPSSFNFSVYFHILVVLNLQDSFQLQM